MYTVIHTKRGSTFAIITLENLDGFKKIIFTYVKGNEYPLQVSYLLIYFTSDVNMTSLSLS